MNKKPSDFVKSSYDKNNAIAVEAVSKWLEKKGYSIINKEEDYWVDIEAEKEGKTLLFEAEVKSNISFTTRQSFRFNTVSFLARKAKWKDTPFWYVILCPSTGYAIIAHSSWIFKDEYIENVNVNTSDRKGMDKFYRVPKSVCFFKKIA